jgi:SOS-response transcriptional repressor LexA
MAARGYNKKSLSREIGLNERLIYDLMKTRDPRNETLAAVAKALNMSLAELRDGPPGGEPSTIQIMGAVAAGEAWTVYADRLGELELQISAGDAVALEVVGDSMSPVYRNGDIIVGDRQDGRRIHNLIGKDCIVQTATGERYVKYLARGTKKDRFNLRSYNPVNPDIENAQIEWAAPVIWIKRGGR